MKRSLIAGVTVVLLFQPGIILASETDGTIDPTFKYAWGENAGWVNFGTAGGNVHVTAAGLTGYAWSQNYGWIKLNPSSSPGVQNDGAGNLSGSAWAEQMGFINFSGVNITATGTFVGTASGTIAGRISFDCVNCRVVTDWRPTAAPASQQQQATGGFYTGTLGPPPVPEGTLALALPSLDELKQVLFPLPRIAAEAPAAAPEAAPVSAEAPVVVTPPPAPVVSRITSELKLVGDKISEVLETVIKRVSGIPRAVRNAIYSIGDALRRFEWRIWRR